MIGSPLLFFATVMLGQSAPTPDGVVGVFGYPVEALRRREQGKVVMDLKISAEAKVVTCTIVESSGSSSLDDGSCKFALKYARFKPARDSLGKPIDGHYRMPMNWKLD